MDVDTQDFADHSTTVRTFVSEDFVPSTPFYIEVEEAAKCSAEPASESPFFWDRYGHLRSDTPTYVHDVLAGFPVSEIADCHKLTLSAGYAKLRVDDLLIERNDQSFSFQYFGTPILTYDETSSSVELSSKTIEPHDLWRLALTLEEFGMPLTAKHILTQLGLA